MLSPALVAPKGFAAALAAAALAQPREDRVSTAHHACKRARARAVIRRSTAVPPLLLLFSPLAAAATASLVVGLCQVVERQVELLIRRRHAYAHTPRGAPRGAASDA